MLLLLPVMLWAFQPKPGEVVPVSPNLFTREDELKVPPRPAPPPRAWSTAGF